MIARFLTLLAVFAALAGLSQAQLTPDKGKHSKEIMAKARMIDMLNHLLPLTLKPDQINKLMSGLEKCRAKETDIENREADELRSKEASIDAAVSKGIKEGAVPSKDLIHDLNRLITAFSIRRQAVASENADLMLEVMKGCLNEGQLKVAANTVDPKAYDKNIKTETMSQDDRIKFFIKAVMLDWSCYDTLGRMLKGS